MAHAQIRYRASFTNSLPQHKPSFSIKIVLSRYTKECAVMNDCCKGVILAREFIEYAFVEVSLSDAKFMGGEH